MVEEFVMLLVGSINVTAPIQITMDQIVKQVESSSMSISYFTFARACADNASSLTFNGKPVLVVRVWI